MLTNLLYIHYYFLYYLTLPNKQLKFLMWLFFICNKNLENVNNSFPDSKCFVSLTRLLRKQFFFFADLHPSKLTYYARLWQTFFKGEFKKLGLLFRSVFCSLFTYNIAFFLFSPLITFKKEVCFFASYIIFLYQFRFNK